MIDYSGIQPIKYLFHSSVAFKSYLGSIRRTGKEVEQERKIIGLIFTSGTRLQIWYEKRERKSFKIHLKAKETIFIIEGDYIQLQDLPEISPSDGERRPISEDSNR